MMREVLLELKNENMHTHLIFSILATANYSSFIENFDGDVVSGVNVTCKLDNGVVSVTDGQNQFIFSGGDSTATVA